MPGNEFGLRVGWNDPNTFWTAERLRNAGTQGYRGPAYQRREIGGTETAFTGRGKGRAVASGYDALGGGTGSKPRALRTSMAALQRAAARGNPGWGVGGYK